MNITDINHPLDIARHCGNDNWRPILCVDWESGSMTVDTKHESDRSWTFRVHHGHEATWDLPLVDATEIRAKLEKLAPMIQAASEQYYSDWDGSNHVARFRDEDEQRKAAIQEYGCDVDEYDSARTSALRAIEEELQYLDLYGAKAWFWDAGEWYGPGFTADEAGREFGITATSADEDLDTAAAKMIEDGEHDNDGHYVILDEDSARSYAENIRDDLAENQDHLEEIWSGLVGPTHVTIDRYGDRLEARRVRKDVWVIYDSGADEYEIDWSNLDISSWAAVA